MPLCTSQPRSERMANFRRDMDILSLYLKTGTYTSGLSPNEQKTVRNRAKTHRLGRNDHLMKCKRGLNLTVLVTEEEVDAILHQYHSSAIGGHGGINSTMAKIIQHYWWLGIKTDVAQFIGSCPKCQRIDKLKIRASQPNHIVISEPLELVCMGLMGPYPLTASNKKYIVAFTDYYTKFVDLFALDNSTAADVAKAIKSFICRWGAPAKLLSDQGNEFLTELNNEICQKFGIKHGVTSAFHADMNELYERMNNYLKNRLSNLAQEQQDDWDEHLEEVAFSIRIQKHKLTGYSPFFLMFGRIPRTALEMQPAEEETDLLSGIKNEEDFVAESNALRRSLATQVTENIFRAQEKEPYFPAQPRKRARLSGNLNLGAGSLAIH